MNNKPTCQTLIDGSKEWCINGELHREDGPAVERANGTKSWWLNGKRHREDGPAVERANGTKSWWLNGNVYTRESYYKKLYELGKITREDYILEMI